MENTNPICKYCGAAMTFYAHSCSIEEERYKFKCPECHAELDEVQEYVYCRNKPFAEGGPYGMSLLRVMIKQHGEWRENHG